MTFGFALILAGFTLLEAGWKGTTPIGVLSGLTANTHGAGGVLSETGRDVMASFTGGGGNSTPSPSEQTEGIPNVKPTSKKARTQESDLKRSHPELHPGVITVVAIILAAFPKLEITATTNGEHATDSYHYKGRAVDLARPMTPEGIAYMNRAAKWINATLSHVLTEGIHNPGLSVKDKKRVSPSFWGSETWQGHTDHIHIAV